MDTPDGADLDGNVDMERDGDDDEEEDEEEEDKDEEEDEDEDNGREPRMIGQQEMVNTSADDADTMVVDQPIVLPEHGLEMSHHTPQPEPPVPAPRPPTPEARPRPRTPETHPLPRLEQLGLVTSHKHRPAGPSLRDAQTASNTLDVDVDQRLLSELSGGDSLPNVPLPNAPLPEACKDGSVGEE